MPHLHALRLECLGHQRTTPGRRTAEQPAGEGADRGERSVGHAPVPEPGPGELLVRCEAIGVTLPVVRKVTEAAEPVPLGGEIAGEVVAVGAGVGRFRVGKPVTGLRFGHGYADYALLGEAMASPIPDTATAVDAVALVRSGLVALGALEAARPERGEAALVTAAASGVGHLAVQLARARGAGRVVGAVPDPAKADFVRSVGGDIFRPALAALTPGGRLVAYSSGGGTIRAYDLLVGAKAVIGFQMARIARGEPELYERWRRELWRLFEVGAVKPVVHGEFALEDASQAHAAIESRVNRGKAVLHP
ncbi:zinc-binding alcohol dehydrogenase family protein [Streptomyces sp. NBC_01092]|uniref:quinone oxidoreductase family protein n=1 Tax=Streptomyces sp. NBC_01092 TaxID=2903748 RepID=UPI00386CBC1B|nr:zinc-binding dehydrogenase [Streptomyces sp. NBC_01092]